MPFIRWWHPTSHAWRMRRRPSHPRGWIHSGSTDTCQSNSPHPRGDYTPQATAPDTGAAPNPMGDPGDGAGVLPRMAPRATPGPFGDNFPLLLGGGGPSTASEITFSPRIRTRPKFLSSRRSSTKAFLLRDVRNSSASLKTKSYVCLGLGMFLAFLCHHGASVLIQKHHPPIAVSSVKAQLA